MLFFHDEAHVNNQLMREKIMFSYVIKAQISFMVVVHLISAFFSLYSTIPLLPKDEISGL